MNPPVELSEAVTAALIIAISLFAFALAALRSAPGALIDRVVAELRSWIGPGACLQDDLTIVVVDIGETEPLQQS
jgi:hypothetical protein